MKTYYKAIFSPILCYGANVWFQAKSRIFLLMQKAFENFWSLTRQDIPEDVLDPVQSIRYLDLCCVKRIYDGKTCLGLMITTSNLVVTCKQTSRKIFVNKDPIIRLEWTVFSSEQSKNGIPFRWKIKNPPQTSLNLSRAFISNTPAGSGGLPGTARSAG